MIIKLNHWYKYSYDNYIYYLKINNKLVQIVLLFSRSNDFWEAILLMPLSNLGDNNNYVKIEIDNWKYLEMKCAKKNTIDIIKLNLKRSKNG